MEQFLHHLNSLDIGLLSTFATFVLYIFRLRVAPITNAERWVVTRLSFTLLLGLLNLLARVHKEHAQGLQPAYDGLHRFRLSIKSKGEVG